MDRLDSFGNPFEGQCFAAGYGHGRREHNLRKRSRATTGMPSHQADDACVFPPVTPVVERLMTDTEFLRNRRGVLLGTEHQHSRRPRARISPRMVDRHLHQRLGFAFRQGQF